MVLWNLKARGHTGEQAQYRVGSNRLLEPEEMDDPQLDSEVHRAALQGLAAMNFLSGCAGSLWRPLRQHLFEHKSRTLRILDIASGSGDVPLQLWRRAQRAGFNLEITCVDISRRALDVARERAAAAGAPFSFRQLDVRSEELRGEYDVVTNSQFLHHLTDGEAVGLLSNMQRIARRMVLVHDLARDTCGLWLAYLATRLFSNSDVVRGDALRSVRAAFTLNEARHLAQQAGLKDAKVERCWPCRYVLKWERSLERVRSQADLDLALAGLFRCSAQQL